MLSHGEDALREEIQYVETALKELPAKEGNEYIKLIARRNIAHQFEQLDWDHKVVTLTAYNFDTVIKEHRVIVAFRLPECSYCDELSTIFVSAFDFKMKKEMKIIGCLHLEFELNIYVLGKMKCITDYHSLFFTTSSNK